jgi:hypothetical protein
VLCSQYPHPSAASCRLAKHSVDHRRSCSRRSESSRAPISSKRFRPNRSDKDCRDRDRKLICRREPILARRTHHFSVRIFHKTETGAVRRSLRREAIPSPP